jgi:hypothetical protein
MEIFDIFHLADATMQTVEKPLMQPLALRTRSLLLAGAAALVTAVAVPAAADPVYSWRTEDGGYAFTDDPKSIPPRYRDQVKVRESVRLDDYKRFTPSDDKAAERYSEQLGRRLEHLRRVNAQPATPALAPTYAAAPPQGGPGMSMRSGDGFTPSVELAPGATASDEPVVVETLFTRPRGKAVTRHTQVVRQGGKTIAIIKPRLREWNVSKDIHDEDELDELE